LRTCRSSRTALVDIALNPLGAEPDEQPGAGDAPVIAKTGWKIDGEDAG
jgi:hypothetical protein